MTKSVLIVKVNFSDFNEHKLAFIEEYLGEQVESSWGNSEASENERGLELHCRWSYSNPLCAEEDYEFVSQKLDELKLANIVSSFSTTLGEEPHPLFAKDE